MRRTSQRLLLLCAPVALVVAACGGGGSSSDEPDETSAPATQATTATTAASETTAVTETTEGTEETKPTTEGTEPDDTTEGTEPDDTTEGTEPDDTTEGTEPSGSGEISSYEAVQPAVIQVETQGSFRDPEIGQASASGSGSGFIISPDGLAVTNNHVVTGAATLEVYVGGDRETSYNAQVLGVSECSDLALIQIDADEELPYLDWYDGDITAGLDVYAAGYPLGDPEFTLTRGIVTKAEADGDITGSSSIDHTVEHDASTHPGNSGGPHRVVRRRRRGRPLRQSEPRLRHPEVRHRVGPRPAGRRPAAGRRLRSARHQRVGRGRRGAGAVRHLGRRGRTRAPRRRTQRSCPATSSRR